MDAIKAAFESQFGTEWSNPVDERGSSRKSDTLDGSSQDNSFEESVSAQSDSSSFSDDNGFENDGLSNSAENINFSESDFEEPITVRHDESHSNQQLTMTPNQRRKFMTAGAPKDDTFTSTKASTKEENDDLKNDLALQRLIEESHILSERPKGQEYTGADISGAGDPLEHIGGSRLKVMQARLSKAGAKQTRSRMPQAMSVGIRDKAQERKHKYKQEARDAGIIIAKERHTKSKDRKRDRGLKINTVGRASEYGIKISAEEIARFSSKGKKIKGKNRR